MVVIAVDRVEAEVAGAARRVPGIVALKHAGGAGSIEGREPTGICRILDLLAHRGEPGQHLDEVAVNENLGVGADCLDSLGLGDQVLLTCHGRGAGPKLLGVEPVLVRNAGGGGKGRVEEAAGVARHENRALLRVPGGQASNLGAREVIVVPGRCAHGQSRAGPAQPSACCRSARNNIRIQFSSHACPVDPHEPNVP